MTTLLTRDEFEDWLNERMGDALDEASNSDASVQRWLARLHASLKVMADEEDGAEDDVAEEEDDADATDEEPAEEEV
jgi:hypothetical protein